MMKPMPGKVLVLPDKPAELRGGIIIPEPAKRDTDKGKVIAIGPDIEEVSIDDRVMFAKNNVTLMDYKGIKYVMVNVDDISAIL